MSVFFCDTNCELWYDRAEELGIKVIKMPYVQENEEYFFDLGKETDFDAFYKKMRSGKRPTTAALNEYDYINYFEPVFKEGQDIFYVSFSHQLSATFESMDKAVKTLKEKYPERKFTCFDTKSISMGAGMQVYEAAKLWKAGANDEELLAFLQDFTKHVACYFCVDSLRHLLKSGRISGVVYCVGSLLSIKPMVKVMSDGTLKSIAKPKGMRKAISDLANIVFEKGEDLDKYEVVIMHADCENYANELANKIHALCGENVNVRIQIVGPVVASHCGVGTLGVIFKSKPETEEVSPV